MTNNNNNKWPKILPPLTPEKKQISDDFMKLWLEVLPQRFGLIETFNHNFPVKYSSPGFTTTLEIGPGRGAQLHYEKLSPEQQRNYYAVELRENVAKELRKDYPWAQVTVGDCQARLDFEDGFFDRVLAVHLLEHLPNLPACIREVWRVVNKQKGQFLVVIPTEGSLAYTMGRKISAERVYKKRYGGDYSWFYKREHINLPWEILEELQPWFMIETKRFFPFPFLPMVFCNLSIGLALKPRPTPPPAA